MSDAMEEIDMQEAASSVKPQSNGETDPGLFPSELRCIQYVICWLPAGQEATVRTGHGTTDWFQIGNGVHQGCILSPCLFTRGALSEKH